ncbi:TetR/AcrR family transcriptional regulator [Pacificimonas sp. ICDLI1SI03]|jgi:AcrR family transcriptional regulator|tara:strand:+ start:26410 stop:27072 length:663 start_codon:yes stop_codon:yes gene_type:complete
MSKVIKKSKRGRPRSISHDHILETAIALTEQQPGVPVSLAGVARAVGMTPMAIYTYFDNKDALLQALTDRMLAGLDITALEAEPPVERVMAWARLVRSHFQKRPQLIDMLVWEGGHGSIAWMNRSAPLATALTELGFQGDELARSLSWLWNSIMGMIHNELRVRDEQQQISSDEIAAIDAPMREIVQDIQRMSSEQDNADRAFDFELARIHDALVTMTES